MPVRSLRTDPAGTDPHSPLAFLAGRMAVGGRRCRRCGFLHLDGVCSWECPVCDRDPDECDHEFGYERAGCRKCGLVTEASANPYA